MEGRKKTENAAPPLDTKGEDGTEMGERWEWNRVPIHPFHRQRGERKANGKT